MLPVNGRDAERTANRIAGNLTLNEALQLCTVTGVPTLIPHHFGLFAFNTAHLAEVDAVAGRIRHPGLLRPDARHLFRLSQDDCSQDRPRLRWRRALERQELCRAPWTTDTRNVQWGWRATCWS